MNIGVMEGNWQGKGNLESVQSPLVDKPGATVSIQAVERICSVLEQVPLQRARCKWPQNYVNVEVWEE